MAKRLKKEDSKKSKISRKRISILILLIIIILFSVYIIQNIFFMNKITKNNSDTSIVEDENSDKNKKEKLENDVEIEIPNKMGDYKVLGAIIIDKIGITKNILDKTTDDSLNLSATKFYGCNLNEIGNFCITGHNYKETFANLDDLDIKDTFYIIDKAKDRKITYEIYDKYTVNPTDLECLNQETDNKREVTIITCNPGGLTRLIVKAREI